eukprot:TRINITY_DN4556_c0_g1_i1.p1 TRINITY_DN4556_c0_g1~~TRINITY_DN4556_c0_g1_i1.p1  ORF type:complete len:395 (-),score=118.92 TRINITY_DN4556_c0_g1_i1:189-1373(-)
MDILPRVLLFNVACVAAAFGGSAAALLCGYNAVACAFLAWSAGGVWYAGVMTRGANFRFFPRSGQRAMPAVHALLLAFVFGNALMMFWRFVTSPLRVLPGVQLIGVQKAGSTTFAGLLQRHPQLRGPQNYSAIAMNNEKEAHYWEGLYGGGGHLWSNSGTVYRMFYPTHWWCVLSQLVLKRQRVHYFDASPDYVHAPWVVPRMLRAYRNAAAPRPKFLLILREPAARAFSQWGMNVAMGAGPDGWNDADFDVALAWEREHHKEHRQRVEELRFELDRVLPANTLPYFTGSFVARSLYAEQITRIVADGVADDLLVVFLEELNENPRREMDRVCTFLGIAPLEDCTVVRRNVVSEARKTKMTPQQKAALDDIFREPNRRLMQLLKRDSLPKGWAV